MRPYLCVMDIDPPFRPSTGEAFAVVSIDPTVRVGTGCKAVVQSLHHSREDAERHTSTKEESNG